MSFADRARRILDAANDSIDEHSNQSAADDSDSSSEYYLEAIEPETDNQEPPPEYNSKIYGQYQEIPEQKQSTGFIPEDITKAFILTVDGTGLVSRSENDEFTNLAWIIEVNGRIELERNAEGELTYRPMSYGNGIYRVWLEGWVDGYQRVSNIIEFTVPLPQSENKPENEIEGFESERVLKAKGHMKHLIRKIGIMEYKLGFVIDPDHDGTCNAIAFYAGRDENGVLQQYLFENSNDLLRFDSAEYADIYGQPCTLGIWCDPESQTDYIVLLCDGMPAIDCCTGELLPDFDAEKAEYFYSLTDSATYDNDHFYVSYQGVPERENA